MSQSRENKSPKKETETKFEALQNPKFSTNRKRKDILFTIFFRE